MTTRPEQREPPSFEPTDWGEREFTVPAGRPMFSTWGVLAFSAIWLVFLADPISTAWASRDTPAGLIGLIATLLIALVYLGAWMLQIRPGWLRSLIAGSGPAGRQAWDPWPTGKALGISVIVVQVVLAAIMMVTLGQSAAAALPFIGVLMVLWLPRVAGPVLVAALVVTVGVLEWVVPTWDPGFGVPLSIAASALAVWGIRLMRQRTRALMDAREENARLAVAEERHRMARDLHDVLGHSLTVITVKIELASRLLEVDPERARAELAHLERLSRDTLHDVRRAVEGYRDLSLAGELVRAREALESADILADLPTAVDDVPTEVRDLYAWTVREGVTNVIRHSGAGSCTVRIAPDRLVIADDGAGPAGSSRSGGVAGPGQDGSGTGGGNGLRGLRERARLAGAVILTRAVDPHGFELTVQVPR